jgi:hypothetical protein
MSQNATITVSMSPADTSDSSSDCDSMPVMTSSQPLETTSPLFELAD